MSIAQRVFPSAGAEPFSRNSRFCNTRPCSLPLSLELVHGPTSSSLHSPICLVDWTRRIRPCPWEICRKTASFSIDYYFLNGMTILQRVGNTWSTGFISLRIPFPFTYFYWNFLSSSYSSKLFHYQWWWIISSSSILEIFFLHSIARWLK